MDKPIIPRRSFFNKADFLGYTGMFSSTETADHCDRLLGVFIQISSLGLQFLIKLNRY
ncbi:hypothetical protein KNP414_05928 [Paenibacillus mucilaginosus KNP414]|uniref:Uncharacterized protein n=1 Tax=Paenibacillus mucilaginosus (strain KNP414) TaxID=1036673 RepID=F8FC51_PAEMK|nr:hypothetical protein KNP414_05928 [Paenibacillus mucilaginosus KNP414]